MTDTFAKVVEVIEVRSTVGKGREDDPIRQIVQYFNFRGQLLATQDPATWFERGPDERRPAIKDRPPHQIVIEDEPLTSDDGGAK